MGRAKRAHSAREGARLSTLDAAALWGTADYERLAQRFGTVHDQLVERLAPRPGERWLDVATGTGGVAVRAAAAGADVVGADISEDMLVIAREKAPSVQFELADCQRLPYEDGSFAVVSSCFGSMFAPDHRATAGELARLCSDRLGLTAWEPNPDLGKLFRTFDLDSPEGRLPFEWGRREHVHDLLGAAFELELESHVWILEGDSGDEIWELWSRSSPLFKAMVARLEADRRQAFQAAYVAYCEQYRKNGRVRVPRPYLLVLGRRR